MAKKTVVRDNDDGSKHITTYDTETNKRRSVDVKDTGMRGPGSNWVEISNPHETDQYEQGKKRKSKSNIMILAQPREQFILFSNRTALSSQFM